MLPYCNLKRVTPIWSQAALLATFFIVGISIYVMATVAIQQAAKWQERHSFFVSIFPMAVDFHYIRAILVEQI